tara:strand:+ start:876 stop:1550 length:675 start_codon:yes stop_codon:yes gene_type:complete
MLSESLKSNLRDIENQFIKGTRIPIRKWRGFNNETQLFCIDKVSLQRSVLHEYCSAIASHINFKDAKTIEVGVEKHEGLKLIFGVSRIERMDRTGVVCGTIVDHVQDLVDDSIEHLKEEFDFVICSNTLEHTYDIHKGIKRLFQLCKSGGYIYISMPFLHGLHLEPYDYWRVTPYAMEKLLADHTDDFIILKEATKLRFPRIVYSKFRLGGYSLHGVSALAVKK